MDITRAACSGEFRKHAATVCGYYLEVIASNAPERWRASPTFARPARLFILIEETRWAGDIVAEGARFRLIALIVRPPRVGYEVQQQFATEPLNRARIYW